MATVKTLGKSTCESGHSLRTERWARGSSRKAVPETNLERRVEARSSEGMLRLKLMMCFFKNWNILGF